jgi:hypothetical protein
MKQTQSSYPAVANALRNDPNKTREIVYGNQVTNEAVAIANFIDSRMGIVKDDIIKKLTTL